MTLVEISNRCFIPVKRLHESLAAIRALEDDGGNLFIRLDFNDGVFLDITFEDGTDINAEAKRIFNLIRQALE